jgi:hypothetical protein
MAHLMLTLKNQGNQGILGFKGFLWSFTGILEFDGFLWTFTVILGFFKENPLWTFTGILRTKTYSKS